MIKTKTIFFSDDTVELMHNDSVSTRPFLMRLTGWNNYYDLRLSEQDLRELAKTILFFIGDQQNDDNT